MASRSGKTSSEYDGTGIADGEPVVGTSGPIAPDVAAGIDAGNTGPGSGDTFDATIHVGRDSRNADGSYTRRRGRKPGGSNHSYSGTARKTSSATDLNKAIEGLTKTLVIVHAGLAGVTSTPEMVIDESEAEMLARASANVLEQFDLKPDPKTQAIVGLVLAAGTVYGPRVYLINQRKAQEKRERRATPNSAGVAGMFDADGNPIGTTGFTIDPKATPKPN